MVYKRYIKKNGKVYGPYEYHSKKKDGKVVSEYRGKEKELRDELRKERSRAKRCFKIVAILLAVLVVSHIFLIDLILTGNATVSIYNTYSPGETITGSVKISMKQGELIPASSKVLIDNAGEVSEYNLSEVLKSDSVEGNFYVDNVDIGGSGLGYGVAGEKKIYPDVNFVMRIVDSDEDIGNVVNESGDVNVSENELNFSEDKSNANKSLEAKEKNASSNSDANPNSNKNNARGGGSGGVPDKSNSGKNAEINIGKDGNENENSNAGGNSEDNSNAGENENSNGNANNNNSNAGGNSNANNDNSNNGNSPDNSNENSNENSNAGGNENSNDNANNDNSNENSNAGGNNANNVKGQGNAPVTGEAVSGTEIDATVSYENPYEYVLEVGQGAEIVSSEQNVELKIRGGKVIVTTDYYEIEKGFGKDYEANKDVEIDLSLSRLYIPAREGDFGFKLVYNGTEIVSAETHVELLESLNESSLNVSLLNESSVNNTLINETVVNETVVIEDVVANIDTTQYGAVVGMPVKWKKNVKLDKPVKNLSLDIPKEAKNITVYKIERQEDFSENLDEVVEEKEEVFEDLNESINESAEESGEGYVLENESFENVSFKSRLTGSFITGDVSAEIKLEEKSTIVKWIKNVYKKVSNKVKSVVTGNAVNVGSSDGGLENENVTVTIEENATEFEIEYETPGPKVFESNTSSGKRVVVSSEIHYKNILAFSELPRETELNNIRLYHYDEELGRKVETEFDAYDSDGEIVKGFEREIILGSSSAGSVRENKSVVYQDEDSKKANSSVEKSNVSVKEVLNQSVGLNKSKGEVVEQNLVSFITWVVPHLSNQTYEIVIEISKAEHLDSDRSFIEDIYDDVSVLDGNYSFVNDSEFVRVTFEESLTSENDITVYGYGSNSSLEIYSGECSGEVVVNGVNVSSEIYAKKKRIDELKEVLNG